MSNFMLLQVFLSLLAGILAGTFTGLFPGIHINLVSALLLFSLPSSPLSPQTSLALAVFIVAMSITHTFLDFIPSVYLGAPEEDNFLSILPGHQLLQKGRGHEAVVLTLYGSLTAIPIILLVTPVFIFALPYLFEAIKAIIPYILIFASLYLIFKEENFILSLLIFLLAGLLGFLTFSLPVREPLLPLLSGLFGLSNLFISVKQETKMPAQKITPLKEITFPKKEFLKTSLAALISAPLCSFLPGIGSGHAATIGSEMIKPTPRRFLFLVGAVNTIVMGLSFVTAYSIGKTRTGSAAAVSSLLQVISPFQLSIIIATIILSSIIAFILGVQLSKLASRFLNKIDYQLVTIAVILILFTVNIIFSNPLGLVVLLVASALGIFTILSESRRLNLMGCLLIPSIVYYLTF